MASRPLIALVLCALIPALASCGDSEDRPYLEFIGGGFIFNYNIAEAYYGFVARVGRRIPEGTIIEARFEDPAGGPPIVVRQTAGASRIEYTFRTPAIDGITANRDYKVELRLLDPSSEAVIASYEKAFRSDVDQAMLPRQPTVIGPAYEPNPRSEFYEPPSPAPEAR